MARLLHRKYFPVWRKYATVFLALFWVLGFLCGIVLFVQEADSVSSLMRMASFGSVSIVNLLISNLLPFLISAFAVSLHLPGLLLIIAFFKAYLFSFLSMGLFAAFGSAGWLIRLLLMFSDLYLHILLYLYWMRYISGQKQFSAVYACGYRAVLLLIGSVDYCYIAPNLVRILSF